jgi:hypothetical protein
LILFLYGGEKYLTVNWNESPILSQMRTGSYQAISESLPIIQNKTVLTEIPDRATKVVVNIANLWNSITTYQVGDLVYTETDGVKSSFECLVSCTNITTTNSTYWQQIYFVELISNTTVLTKYQYYIDYVSGLAYLNSYFNDSQLIFEYQGKGNTFTSTNRIFSKSVGSEVTETLEQLIETSAKSITFHIIAPTVSDGVDGDIWFVYQE